jgi:hypothetical protein
MYQRSVYTRTIWIVRITPQPEVEGKLMARRLMMRSAIFSDPGPGAAGRRRSGTRRRMGGRARERGVVHGRQHVGSKGEEGRRNGGVAAWRWRRRGQGGGVRNGDGGGLEVREEKVRMRQGGHRCARVRRAQEGPPVGAVVQKRGTMREGRSMDGVGLRWK